MPFSDIFTTPVLLFPGGRKQRGAPGNSGAVTVARGEGVLTCAIRARGLAKTEDPIHCPCFPQEHCWVSPSTRRASFPSLVKAWFLPDGVCWKHWGYLYNVPTLLPGMAPLRWVLCSGRSAPPELHPELESSALQSEVMRHVCEGRHLPLDLDGRQAGWGCYLKRWKAQLSRPLRPPRWKSLGTDKGDNLDNAQ